MDREHYVEFYKIPETLEYTGVVAPMEIFLTMYRKDVEFWE